MNIQINNSTDKVKSSSGRLRKMSHFIVLAIALLAAFNSFGQSSSIQISVSATVVADSPVEIITISNIRLDVADMVENEIYISPLSNPNAGLFQIKGQANSDVRIKYQKQETIVSDDNTGSIAIAYELSVYPENIQTASYAFTSEEEVIQFGETGIYFIWVGGRINLANATSGAYSGQFSIEIEYI